MITAQRQYTAVLKMRKPLEKLSLHHNFLSAAPYKHFISNRITFMIMLSKTIYGILLENMLKTDHSQEICQ